MFPSIYSASPFTEPWSVPFNEFGVGPIQSVEGEDLRLSPHAPGAGSDSSSRSSLIAYRSSSTAWMILS